jgi:primosomal protein N' (replication factor Y)
MNRPLTDEIKRHIVEVAVSDTSIKNDKLYTYSVPEHLRKHVSLGARVLVSFGRSKPRIGVILGVDVSCDIETDNIKEIIEIERGNPVLNEDLVDLIFYIKKNTLCRYFDAIKAVLPKNSRLIVDLMGKSPTLTSPSSHLETVYLTNEAVSETKMTKRQREVYDLITSDGKGMTLRQIRAETSVSKSVIDKLVATGALSEEERLKEPELFGNEFDKNIDFELTPNQQKVFDSISEQVKRKKRNTTLLYGVTGSGKTVIFIKLVEKVLAEKKTAVVLVPEIVLATQMIYRLRRLFGDRVGLIHSSLSDVERHIQWERIRNGNCDIVVGTRSAVFAPVSNIGIIIIDEHQEQSYLSEQNPRYSAVETAAYRAKRHGAHLLLSSATPSIESYHDAVKGRINLVSLEERYKDMPLPDVEIIDMKEEMMLGNSGLISLELSEKIRERITRGEQCILLLNRRGYRTLTLCRSCRKAVKCRYCDSALVYHKVKNRFICHICGFSRSYFDKCEECGGELKNLGIGTQKIEEQLAEVFPEARIMRLDFDAVSKKGSAAAKIKAFSERKYDILIGTQMVAKGLDFDNVTLVGVLSVDQLLLMPSFRANERTFSMLTQVVGRSGRGEKKGSAVIQTLDPTNKVIELAAKQDYNSFYEWEIISRKAHLYPPFCSISSVGILGKDEKKVIKAAGFISKLIEKKVMEGDKIPIRVLGPVPMRVSYAGNNYRYKLTIKSRGDESFVEMMDSIVKEYYESREFSDIRIYVNFYDDSE